MIDEVFGVFPQISTQRLILREIKAEDTLSIYELLSNSEVIKYDSFDLFTSIKQAEDIINWFSQEYKNKKAIFWGISLIDDSKIIGFCKCEIEIPKVRADFGYDLRPEYWNNGIMCEALKAIVEFTFSKLQVNRIEATVSIENKASIRVLQKIGFTVEGILRERSYWRGSFYDMAI